MEDKLDSKIFNPLTGSLYKNINPRVNKTELYSSSINNKFKPIPSDKSLEERLKIISSIGQECIKEEELVKLLKTNKFIYAYDGFEPSGRMHIAQGVMKAKYVNKLVDAGCIFIFWVADWFSPCPDHCRNSQFRNRSHRRSHRN